MNFNFTFYDFNYTYKFYILCIIFQIPILLLCISTKFSEFKCLIELMTIFQSQHMTFLYRNGDIKLELKMKVNMAGNNLYRNAVRPSVCYNKTQEHLQFVFILILCLWIRILGKKRSRKCSKSYLLE